MQAKITRGLVSADRSLRARTRQKSQAEFTEATTTSASAINRIAKLVVPNRVTGYVMVAMIVAFALFFSARLTVRGEIYPGIHVASTPLGGLSGTEARALLDSQSSSFDSQKVTLSFQDKTWTPTLGELGITLDVEGAVHQAMAYGRDDHVIVSLLRPFGVDTGSVNVPLALRIDHYTLDATLAAYAHEAGIAPQDAKVTIVDGKISIEADHDGLTFDGSAFESNLLAQLHTTDATSSLASITLQTREQSATTRSSDVAAVEQTLNTALSAPMTFSGVGQRWTLSIDELAKMVVVQGPNSITLNSTSLEALAQQLGFDVDREPTDAYVDQSGEVARLVAGQSGRTLRVGDFIAAVNRAFVSGQHAVTLPIDETPASSTTDSVLADLGITDLISVGTSDFAGSEPGRMQNVDVSARLVDGVLIPPGGEFTFNHSIGEINVTPGFVPAGASENGIAGTAVGGGVCQVTTTIFRAALKAGLPITEWWPHAYRNIYYEQGGWAPGFDASVQQPDDDPFAGSDLVFQNPTDGWILVRSSITDETKLTIELYGSPTGYTVEIDDPIFEDYIGTEGLMSQESIDPSLPDGTVKEIQPARDGVTTTVVRRVLAADGTEISTDSFVSHYEPQGASYAVSPDMAGSTSDES